MKTLKEFITEAKKSGVDKYPTGLHPDQDDDEGYEFNDRKAIANAGPRPSIEKMMKKAMSGKVKYRRFIPKGTDMTNPDKPVVKLYQVKENKKK